MNFEHIKKFEQGKQGVAGLVKEKSTNQYLVYKIPQYMNFLASHEYLIMKGLNELNEFCPHFCKVRDNKIFKINPLFKDENVNPFEKGEFPSLELNVVMMEYIEDSIPFFKLIENKRIPFYIIMNIFKQIVVAIKIAQREKKFVHYDLHTMNILMQPCDPDDVHVYVLDKENVVTVPTYGWIPIIIDYGFGRSDDINNHPMNCSLAFTDAGYMSPAYDPLADMKILLVSMSEDLKGCRHRRKDDDAQRFRNISKHIFYDLNIDWRSGWDISDDIPIIDQLFEYVEDENEESIVFTEFSHYSMDILQNLITLPLSPNEGISLRELKKAYTLLVHEFNKLEREINDPFYSLYILRQTVTIARGLIDEYVNEDTQYKTIDKFEHLVFAEINKVAKFVRMEGVNFEAILCALYVFKEQLEGQLYFLLEKTMREKYVEYSNMKVQGIDEILAIFEINFPSNHYVYNEKSKIHFYDSIKRTHQECRIPSKYLDKFNRMSDCMKGVALTKIRKEL